MPAAIPIMLGVTAAAGIGSAVIGSNAAGNAASVQANAANEAAQLQYQSGQNALDFQKQVWNQQQANAAPWLQTGGTAVSTLDQLMGLNPPNIPANYGQPQLSVANIPSVRGGPGGSTPPPLQNIPGGSLYSRGIGMPTSGTNELSPAWGRDPRLSNPVSLTGAQPQGTMRRPGVPAPAGQPGSVAPGVQPGVANGNLVPFAPWNQQFVAPTAEQARQTPGYQFVENQGMQAVQNSAAARGDLLSGNTLTGLEQYGQGLADTTYQQTYDRALGQYQQNYNIYENNQANQWNRLAALAGYGQTAVGQLNSAGANAAGNTSNILLNTGANIGRDIQNAAAANASGYVGAANAWSGALGGLSGMASLLPFYSMMNQNTMNQYGAGGGAAAPAVTNQSMPYDPYGWG